jgi:hypothetical protein
MAPSYAIGTRDATTVIEEKLRGKNRFFAIFGGIGRVT